MYYSIKKQRYRHQIQFTVRNYHRAKNRICINHYRKTLQFTYLSVYSAFCAISILLHHIVWLTELYKFYVFDLFLRGKKNIPKELSSRISIFGKYHSHPIIIRVSIFSNEQFEDVLILTTDYRVDHLDLSIHLASWLKWLTYWILPSKETLSKLKIYKMK